MKTNFAILSIFVSMISLLKAQNLSLGIHTGATATKILWVEPKNTIIQPIQPSNPQTYFRIAYVVGINADFRLSSRFYIPVQTDFYQKRFAVEVEEGVVFTGNEFGQLIAVQTDAINYRSNQIALNTGIGINLSKSIAVELMPYMHASIGNQQGKVAADFPWIKLEDFQQGIDLGMSAYFRWNLNWFYFKAGYQFGFLPSNTFPIYDLDFSFAGYQAFRNTMFLVVAGYSIIK